MLTTWATVRDRLSLDEADQSATENLIAVASRRADAYTGRNLKAADRAVVMSGIGSPVLMLADRPVVSISSINVDSTRQFLAGTEVTNYYIDEERGVIIRNGGIWPQGSHNIKVTGRFGYEEIPTDLEESIIQLVAYWLDSPSIAYVTPQQPAAQGGYQANYVGAMDLPYQVRNCWDYYREVRV